MIWRWRTRREQDLERELRSHLELEAEEQQEKGLPAKEARLAAQRAFGNRTLIEEDVRAMWTWLSIDRLTQDLRYALRAMRKSPGYIVVALLTMTVGIASTTLMFTVLNSVVLKPPPFKDPGALFMLWEKIPQQERVSFSTRNFLAYQNQTQVVESMAAFTGSGFTLLGRGEPELEFGQMVTPAFFSVLGVRPYLGRTFLPSEGEQGNHYKAILSHGLWRSKFGERAGIVGQSVVLNGDTYSIVGVMPKSFDFPDPRYKLWVPAALNGPVFQQHIDAHFLRVLARTKPGMSVQRLQAEMAVLGKRIDEQDRDPLRAYYAVPLPEMLNGNLRRPLLVLMLAVTCLLIIACANVANLALARASTRNRELAVRGAMGASRRRLIQQLLLESVLLALAGGAVGLGLAYWGLHLLIVIEAKTAPQLLHARIDFTGVAFAFVASTITGVLSGLTPAFTASQIDFRTALNEGGRTAGNFRSDRARRMLVFAEVALSALLLISAGLMMRSFVSLMRVHPGFRASGVVTAEAVLRENRYPDSTEMLRIYRRALESIRSLPGVKSAAMITHLPFGGNDWGNIFEIEERPSPPGKSYEAQIRPISNDYFRSMNIPLRRGRDFTERDNEGAMGVAIINEKLANEFWPATNPLGRRIRFDENWLSIVGVSGNNKSSKLDADFEPQIYVPYPQVSPTVLKFVGRDNNYVVASTVAPSALGSALRAKLHALDPEMVVEVNLMEQLIDDSMAQPRFRTWLIGMFSLVALALVSVGIYGVVSYTVTQRYRDLGIRIALGAERGSILRSVLARNMLLAVVAVLVGATGALFTARFLRSLLFGITAHDPVTFVCIPLFLILVAFLASYIPARRATKIDPIIALRYE